jgi:hypothetical protein
MVKRREFITLLGGAAAVWPLAARAQSSTKVARIGVLYIGLADAESFKKELREALRELGYVEGQNIAFEFRSAEGKLDRLRHGCCLSSFFAVPLIFERVIEPERFLAFATLFCFVRLVALAPEPFDDFFDLRCAAFAMFPPGAPYLWAKTKINESFCPYLNVDDPATAPC